MVRQWLCSIVWLVLAAGGAAAQNYPERPVRLIVPQAPGSSSDTLARVLATELGRQLGQQIVVDNRPGGVFTIGMELVARAIPDGYTIGYAPIGAIAISLSCSAARLCGNPGADLICGCRIGALRPTCYCVCTSSCSPAASRACPRR